MINYIVIYTNYCSVIDLGNGIEALMSKGSLLSVFPNKGSIVY